jgi:hypothetical protein
LHKILDTQLRFSSAYHPQTDGQTKSVNQILEDMLRAYALQYGRSWDKSLSYAEFFYNNSYQDVQGKVFGPDILQEAEKQVRMVRENLQLTQLRQKSYIDHRRRELSFEVRDFVYLKVSPTRSLSCFKVQGKLAPRFIGPFKILEKRGEVAYQLELPLQLSDMHDVCHVFQLNKCLRVPKEQLPMEELEAKEDLSYQESPVKILETSERVTRNKKIKMCKVQWSHHTEEEAT